MKAKKFIILQIFFATRAVLKIGEYRSIISIFKNWFMLSVRISSFIIQQIVTLSKYGHDALDISHM